MGKSVVVTGANSGIGLATALELARVGYDVIGTARTQDKADALVEAGRERGLTVRTALCDVADDASTREGFAEIARMTDGGPWAVVNNAGFAQAGAVEDVTAEDARYQLEVNLVAPARIAQLVLPAMRERGDGRIVNVSSIAGRVSAPLTGWYAASKHGLEALSDALRIEVAKFGVRVVLIEPGGFGTGIWDAGAESFPAPEGSAYADVYDRARAMTLKGKHFPDPVWVGRVIRLALANPVPLPRYLVGVDAVAMAAGEALAPTALSDYVKGVGAGVRSLLPGR
ncbi:MAG: Short-chain dehydrogenase/reductase [Frankiales bacterium]|nr:Short-chain dehydrogenase/reductase [Frankiales bacterium]